MRIRNPFTADKQTKGKYKKVGNEAKLKDMRSAIDVHLFGVFATEIKSHPSWATEIAMRRYSHELGIGEEDGENERYRGDRDGYDSTSPADIIENFKVMRDLMKEFNKDDSWKQTLIEAGMPILQTIGGALSGDAMSKMMAGMAAGPPQQALPGAEQPPQLGQANTEEDQMIKIVAELLAASPTRAVEILAEYKDQPQDIRGILFNVLCNNSMESLYEQLDEFKTMFADNPTFLAVIDTMLSKNRREWIAYVRDSCVLIQNEGVAAQLRNIPVDLGDSVDKPDEPIGDSIALEGDNIEAEDEDKSDKD